MTWRVRPGPATGRQAPARTRQNLGGPVGPADAAPAGAPSVGLNARPRRQRAHEERGQAAAQGPRPRRAGRTSDRLKDAVEDLDKARDQAGQQAKESIDSAIARIREAASELGDKARDQTAEWQTALESAGDDVLRELGRRAVRAQRSPAALKDLSDEIRRRKAELAA